MFTAVPISPVHDASPCSPVFAGEYHNMVGGQMQFYAFEYYHGQGFSAYYPAEDRTVNITRSAVRYDRLVWHGAGVYEAVSTNLSNESLPEGWILGDVYNIGSLKDIPDPPPSSGVFPYWQNPAQLIEQETTLRNFVPQDADTTPFPGSQDAPFSNPFVAGEEIWFSGNTVYYSLRSQFFYIPAWQLAYDSAQVRTAIYHSQRIQVAYTVDGWRSKDAMDGWKAYMGWCFEGIFVNPVVLQAVRVAAKDVRKLYEVEWWEWRDSPTDRKFWKSRYPNPLGLGVVEAVNEWLYYTDHTGDQPDGFNFWNSIENVACDPTQPYLNAPAAVYYQILGNGSVTPAGRVNPLILWLAPGADVTLTLLPADGWHLASVALSGVVIATTATVQLTNVRRTQSLRVVFMAD